MINITRKSRKNDLYDSAVHCVDSESVIMEAAISDREAFLWSQRGITFKIPTIDYYKDIKTFLVNIFFPEEPFFRALNLMEKSKIDILERHFVKFILEKRKVKNGLKEATSMIALDETNTIVGVRYDDIYMGSSIKAQRNSTVLVFQNPQFAQ